MDTKLRHKILCPQHNIKSTIFDTSNRKNVDIPEVECDSKIPISRFFDGFTKIHKVHCPYCGGDAAFLFPSADGLGELRCADINCDRELGNILNISENLVAVGGTK